MVETTNAARTAEKAGANTESRIELEARVDAEQKTSMSIMDFDTPGLIVGAEKRRQRRTEQETRKVESKDSVAQAESRDREPIKPELKGKVRVGFQYSVLKPVLDFAHKFVKDLILTFAVTGLYSRFMDPAHVLLGSFHIPREEFIEYDGITEEVTAIMDVEDIRRLKIKGAENVWMEFTPKEGNIKLRCNDTTNTIALKAEGTVTAPKMLMLDLSGHVTIPASTLGRFLNSAKDISDAFRMTLTRDRLTLLSSADSGRVETIVTDTEWDSMEPAAGILNNGAIRSLYPTEYVRNATMALGAAAEWVKMSFRDDYPMEAEFRLKNRPETKIAFLLAPRMEQ